MAVPAAPTALVATPSTGQVSIAFTPGADGGSAITDYDYNIGSAGWVSAAVAVSPVVVTGLTNGTTVSIELRAVNGDGDGAASAPLSTASYAVPGVVTALVATKGNTTASIAFTAGSAGGGQAFEYNVAGGGWLSTNPATVASPMVVPGLTNGTEVSITLRGTNPAGSSAASAAVLVTPSTTPAAPDVTATAGDNQVSLAYTIGTGGSAITDMQYNINGDGWVSSGDVTTPVVVTGLPNGIEASIVMRGVNANGNGAASTADLFTPADPSAANDNGWDDANPFANPGLPVPHLDYNDPDD